MYVAERWEKSGAEGGNLVGTQGWGVLYFPDRFWFLLQCHHPGIKG